MSTIHTRYSVYNMALDYLDEMPIIAPPGSGVAARWLNRNFDRFVDVELSSNFWNFALEYHELQRDGLFTKTSRWGFRYAVPVGALRIVPPTYDGRRDGRLLDFANMRGGVLLNHGPKLKSWWVMRIENPGEWEPLFAEVVAATLAINLAHKITGKASFIDRLTSLRGDLIEKAYEINALERSPEPIEAHDILRVRGLGGDTYGDGYDEGF